MKAKELLNILQKCPDLENTFLFIESSKGGLELVSGVIKDEQVALNANVNIDYIAPHELISIEDDDDKVYLDMMYEKGTVVKGWILRRD